MEIESPCELYSGDIPTTTLVPVAGGTIRNDDRGTGDFGAPRGTGFNHGVDIAASLGSAVKVVYAGRVVAVQMPANMIPKNG